MKALPETLQQMRQTALSIFFFLAFSGFIDRIAEECDRKQGKRGGVTRSKGTQAGSRACIPCRASAHGSRALPTELSGAQALSNSLLKGL